VRGSESVDSHLKKEKEHTKVLLPALSKERNTNDDEDDYYDDRESKHLAKERKHTKPPQIQENDKGLANIDDDIIKN